MFFFIYKTPCGPLISCDQHGVCYFTYGDEDFDTKRLWKSVSGYIGKAYDTEALERIRVHADGGNWIKNGLGECAQTVHIMDGFHERNSTSQVAPFC